MIYDTNSVIIINNSSSLIVSINDTLKNDSHKLSGKQRDPNPNNNSLVRTQSCNNVEWNPLF